MFKIIRKVIKWIVRLAILALIIIALIFIYNFLLNGLTGQATSKCQEITKQNGSGKEIVYTSLADWLKTQSTSVVTVTSASYQNDAKRGDQIIINFSLYKNIYSGQKTINQATLEKYCGV
jgi:hypothetical protein